MVLPSLSSITSARAGANATGGEPASIDKNSAIFNFIVILPMFYS